MIKAKIKETHKLGSRVISIQSRKLNTLSMQRVLTVTEENHTTALKEAKLPIPVFPHDIFEMRREFPLEKLNDMLKKTSSFQSTVKQVRPFATRNQTRLSVFRPIVGSINPITWAQTRAALEVGIFGGYDVIAVPDHHFASIQEYKQYVSKSREHVYDASTSRKGSFECMPTVSITNNRLDELKAKLKFFRDSGINAINVENSDFMKYYPHYNAIREFSKNNDVMIYGSEVKRSWVKTNASLMHIYPFFGIDFVALNRPQKPFLAKEGQRSVHDQPKSRAKLYDPTTDGILSRGEYSLIHGENLQSNHFPLLAHESLTTTFDRFDNQLLMKITKLHESVECFYEMQRERDAVLNGDYREIMQQKKCVAPVVNMVQQQIL